MVDCEVLKTPTRWIGLLSSLLTAILGIVYVVTFDASVHWPQTGFLEDVNVFTWRTLFTFRPDFFAFHWTPLAYGIIGLMLHLEDYIMKCCTKTFAHYFVFNLIKGLFADIGYSGGLGIIFSAVTWLTCVLCLICYFTADDSASLRLTAKLNLQSNKT